MSANQRRKMERRLMRHFKPLAKVIDDLASGVESGEVSVKELRDISDELRRCAKVKEPK